MFPFHRVTLAVLRSSYINCLHGKVIVHWTEVHWHRTKLLAECKCTQSFCNRKLHLFFDQAIFLVIQSIFGVILLKFNRSENCMSSETIPLFSYIKLFNCTFVQFFKFQLLLNKKDHQKSSVKWFALLHVARSCLNTGRRIKPSVNIYSQTDSENKNYIICYAYK